MPIFATAPARVLAKFAKTAPKLELKSGVVEGAYYNAAQKIIVPSNNTEFDDCKEAADVEAILKTKDKSCKIGVQTGTTGEFYSAGDADWGFDGFDVETKVTRVVLLQFRIC